MILVVVQIIDVWPRTRMMIKHPHNQLLQGRHTQREQRGDTKVLGPDAGGYSQKDSVAYQFGACLCPGGPLEMRRETNVLQRYFAMNT
jgi:hypothetical protein